jgi:hypothetical protein
VRLTSNILHEEIKSLTQTPYEASRDFNPWTTAKPSRPTTTRTPKTAHTSSGLANSSQYTDQTTNPFAALTSHAEPQQLNSTTFFPDSMQKSRRRPKINN